MNKNFREELQELSRNYSSQKLDNVKKMIIEAAFNGQCKIEIKSEFYDQAVINWLRCQGLKVKEIKPPSEENFITVQW